MSYSDPFGLDCRVIATGAPCPKGKVNWRDVARAVGTQALILGLAYVTEGASEFFEFAEGAEAIEGGSAAADAVESGGAAESKAFSKEKQAVVDMAKRDKRTGITNADMEAYKELNKELPDPFPTNKVRGPESHSRGAPTSRQPHGHVGPVDHIPIIDGNL